jgi:hypothetical protein
VLAGASEAGVLGSGSCATGEEAIQEVRSIAPRTRPERTIASLDDDFFMVLLDHLYLNSDCFLAFYCWAYHYLVSKHRAAIHLSRRDGAAS